MSTVGSGGEKVTRTIHTCVGCYAELASKRDLTKRSGTVGRSWSCAYCGTTVPSIVAERIAHQKQHEPEGK